MSQRNWIPKVSVLAMLIVGAACNSPPVLHRIKNPGRRVEPLSVSQNSNVPTAHSTVNPEPVDQSSLPAPENQLSNSISQQTATEAFATQNPTGSSLADAVSVVENNSKATPVSTNTELDSRTISIAPINSVELASGHVVVPNTVAQSVPTVRLVIAGVRVSQGKVKIAIYTDAGSFPNPAGASQAFELAATNSTIETSLTDMKRFAVAVYQDINSDGELNRNRLGIPIEPFAFSNNVMGKRGPPSFEQAAIVQPTEAGEGGNGPLVVSIQLP